MRGLILGLLALFGVNAFLKGPIFLGAVFLLLIVWHGRMRITGDVYLLMAFALGYMCVDYLQNGTLSVTVLFCPVAYLAGLNWEPELGDTETVFRHLAVTMAAHGILNFVWETAQNGGFLYDGVHYDFWSGQVSAVTAQMTNYVLLTCLVGQFSKRPWLAVLQGISLLHAVLSGSRSYLVLLGLAVAVHLLVKLRESHAKGRFLGKLLLWGGCGCLVLTAAFRWNWLGVREFWESSYLYHRLHSDYAVEHERGLLTTGRWDTKLQYLALLPEYPWGGRHIQEALGFYAHDLWLDTADRVGLIPFGLLVAYTIRMGHRLLKTARRERSGVFYSCFVLVLAQFAVEPVLSGSPVLLLAVCMLDGMLTNWEDTL